MEDRQPALEREGLWAEEFSIDLSVFGKPVVGRVGGVAPLFAAEGGFGEGGEVEAGGFVGGEVGGEEEVGGCLGEGECGWGARFSVGLCCRREEDGGGKSGYTFWGLRFTGF